MFDSDYPQVIQAITLSMLFGVWLTIFFKRDFKFKEYLSCRVRYVIFLPTWLMVLLLINSDFLTVATSVGTLAYVCLELKELAFEEKWKCVALGFSLMLVRVLNAECQACIAVLCALTQLLRWPIDLKNKLRELRIIFGPVYTIFIVGSSRSCIKADFASVLLNIAAGLALLASILLRPDNSETLRVLLTNVPTTQYRKMTHGLSMFFSFLLCMAYIVNAFLTGAISTLVLCAVGVIALVNFFMYICVADFPRMLIKKVLRQ